MVETKHKDINRPLHSPSPKPKSEWCVVKWNILQKCYSSFCAQQHRICSFSTMLWSLHQHSQLFTLKWHWLTVMCLAGALSVALLNYSKTWQRNLTAYPFHFYPLFLCSPYSTQSLPLLLTELLIPL